MNKQMKAVVKYFKSLNVEGKKINLRKRLYSNLEKAYNCVYVKNSLHSVESIVDLNIVSESFDYFFDNTTDNYITLTYDASRAIDGILYGIYLVYFNNYNVNPVNFEEFRTVEYYLLGEENENVSKYYIVEGLDSDDDFFYSITKIKEIADEKGLSLEDLEIFDVIYVPLTLDASGVVEEGIYIGDFVDEFTVDEVPKQKMRELQLFLNEWCKDVYTNTYERKDLLNIEEVMRRLKNE